LIILWKEHPLKCKGLPDCPTPFSPASILQVNRPNWKFFPTCTQGSKILNSFWRDICVQYEDCSSHYRWNQIIVQPIEFHKGNISRAIRPMGHKCNERIRLPTFLVSNGDIKENLWIGHFARLFICPVYIVRITYICKQLEKSSKMRLTFGI
jgi:hypothetical protein